MARKLKSDKVLFLATFLLVCGSVLMVYSASALLAMNRYGQPNLFLVKQLFWMILGLAVLAVVMRIDYRTYNQPVIIWTAVGVACVALVAVLFSAPVNGARRWFGFGGIGVQPSELAKLAAIVFAAGILERRMHRIDEVSYSLMPVAVTIGVLVTLIMLEPDYGTAMVLVLIAAAMVFAAGVSYRHVLGLALATLPLVSLLILAAPYRRERILAFLNPWADPLGAGYQAIQSLIAVGAGGVAGRGFMTGVQKLYYVPEPHTDFIFAVIAEELGLIGSTVVLACFGIIVWRGLHVAAHAPDRFGALLAVGLTVMVAVQALINISVVIGLLPTKGLPLPFVSAGGSSLLINLAGMGILLNVSQHASVED